VRGGRTRNYMGNDLYRRATARAGGRMETERIVACILAGRAVAGQRGKAQIARRIAAVVHFIGY
jgi:hypothetical protein